MAKRFWRILRAIVIGLFLALFVIPYSAGFLSYFTNFGGIEEQYWLNAAIYHIRDLKTECQDDPELQGVLDYTIQRYNQIGPFDVSVSRCWRPFQRERWVTLGYNNPLIPGVTLDIKTLTDYPLHDGAMVLVHEALHDYPPYLGHSYVTPVMDRLEERYVLSRTNRPEPRPSCPTPNSNM